MNLSGKKILFLSANFFGYEEAITNRLRELGAEVDFYNERPSDSVLSKGIIRVNKNFYFKKINSYYQKILKETNEDLQVNQVKNLTDLALLSQGLLKGNELSDFINRSVDMMEGNSGNVKSVKPEIVKETKPEVSEFSEISEVENTEEVESESKEVTE